MTAAYEEISATTGNPANEVARNQDAGDAAPPARAALVSDRLPEIAICAVLLATFWHLAAAVWRYSVNVLFWDQWDFYTPLFQRASYWQIFTWQHGPHREGIGLILDKFVLDSTGWNAKAEVFFMMGALFAATLLALLLKHKLFGRYSYSDIVIPCLFLTFAQMEIFTGAPNPSYSAIPELLLGSYCLGWVSILATGSERSTLHSAGRYFALLLLNFLLIFDGYGFFAGPITLGLLILTLRREFVAKSSLRVPSIALLIALLSLAAFFSHYRWDPAAPGFHFPDPNPLRYPWFIALAFGYFLGLRSSMPATIFGGVVALATSVILVLHLVRLWRARDRRGSSLDVIVVILSAFSLSFVANAAIGRVFLGMPESAQVSRYMGLLVPAFLAIYLHLLSSRNGVLPAAVVVLFVVAIIPGTVRMPSGYSPQIVADGKQAWKSCILQVGNIDDCDRATGFPIYPDARKTHLLEKLQYLQKNHLNLYSDNR
jgi:hypothetical protein